MSRFSAESDQPLIPCKHSLFFYAGPSGPAAFKTAALNHSATCPCPRRHSAGAALGKRNLFDLRPGAALTRIVAASPVQGWCIRGIPCLWVSDERQQAKIGRTAVRARG